MITNNAQTLAYSYVRTSVIWRVIFSAQRNPVLVIDTMTRRRAGQQNCRLIPAIENNFFLFSIAFRLALRTSQSHIQWAPGVVFLSLKQPVSESAL